MNVAEKVRARARRHERVRSKIVGTATRPRLCVFRSALHIYGQVIDDLQGRTLAQASSGEAEIKATKFASRKEVAKAVGRVLADRAKKAGATQVVFDRAGYLYHGRVKAFAEGVREGGLEL